MDVEWPTRCAKNKYMCRPTLPSPHLPHPQFRPTLGGGLGGWPRGDAPRTPFRLNAGRRVNFGNFRASLDLFVGEFGISGSENPWRQKSVQLHRGLKYLCEFTFFPLIFDLYSLSLRDREDFAKQNVPRYGKIHKLRPENSQIDHKIHKNRPA